MSPEDTSSCAKSQNLNSQASVQNVISMKMNDQDNKNKTNNMKITLNI